MFLQLMTVQGMTRAVGNLLWEPEKRNGIFWPYAALKRLTTIAQMT